MKFIPNTNENLDKSNIRLITQEHQELKARKRKIEDDLRIGNISNKFSAHVDSNEIKLKSDTVGQILIMKLS